MGTVRSSRRRDRLYSWRARAIDGAERLVVVHVKLSSDPIPVCSGLRCYAKLLRDFPDAFGAQSLGRKLWLRSREHYSKDGAAALANNSVRDASHGDPLRQWAARTLPTALQRADRGPRKRRSRSQPGGYKPPGQRWVFYALAAAHRSRCTGTKRPRGGSITPVAEFAGRVAEQKGARVRRTSPLLIARTLQDTRAPLASYRH
jgi:hypothetical protein